jgi:hypothetical protein
MGATNSSGQLTTYQNGGVAPTQANIEKALREDSLNKQKANDEDALNRQKVMAPPPPSVPYWSDEIAKSPTPTIKSDQTKTFSNPLPSGPFGSSFDIGEYIRANDTYNVLKGIPKSQLPSTIFRPQPFTGDSRMAGQALQSND